MSIGNVRGDHRAVKFIGAFLVLAAVAVLAGCGAGQKKLTWDTQDVTGGLPALEFTLTDDNGRVVHASDYAGKVRLLYFGYTHCPDVCPTTLAMLQNALGMMGKDADAVQVLFVSVDPRRDNSTVLKTYAAAFGPHILGLSGTQAQLRAVTSRYHVTYSYYAPDANGDYVVQHSAAVFVFDRQGRARLMMEYQKGAKAVAHDLRQLVAER